MKQTKKKDKNTTQYPCACGANDCPVGISFDGLRLIMTLKDGGEQLMYLDHNTAHELIDRLKEEMVK